MDTRQINETLQRIFDEEGHRIVFWNDPQHEFGSILPGLAIDNVNILRLDEIGALEVKIRIEREDTAGRYLLYSPAEEPDYESDWLLDVRLYSRSFRADRASLILNELGLSSQHLRQHMADRRKYFDSKDRLQKLKPLVAASDTADDLDRKMIGIVCKAEQPEWFIITRTLLHDFGEGGEEIDLDNPPAAWAQIEKFDLSEAFWQMAQAAFGYREETPSLKNLLIRLLVTDYAAQLNAPLPAALGHLVLPAAAKANAIVCLAQWRDSSSKSGSYDRLSEEVAALIDVGDHLAQLDLKQLDGVMTFLAAELAIASRLRDRVANTASAIKAEEIREIAGRRQAGHWASLTVADDAQGQRRALHAVYDALVAGAEFFALRNRHQTGFDYEDAAALYHAYESELFRFDQLYRHFCEAADRAESQSWHLLKPLRDSIEQAYTNWFVPQLALGWGKFVEGTKGASLLSRWRIEQVANQHQFFEKQIRPRIEEAENRRAFVIISDAFRYEAAEELVGELNGRYRFEATLGSQLGVLPSYTALGMGSLLPHKMLTYKPNGDVLADGRATASLEQRNAILESAGGMACRAADLMAMKKEQGREFINGRRVVYIYHNTVDAIGDSASTEDQTFAAVRQAIDELAALVTYVINNLNGHHLSITADHGFLFTESAPGAPDKSKIAEKPAGTVRAKKRYLIGHNLPETDAAWRGDTATTAAAEGGMAFWIPKAANRFHFAGGARFVHGGAMLQEIVVPVITVRHVRGKSAKETKVKRVTVQVLGGSHKITTNRYRFELIQMEPVSERVKPLTLKVAIYEGDEPVTNIERVTFDSLSDRMDDRKRWVPLVLKDRDYDKKTAYRLVLRDAETGIEQQSVSVVIDRAFSDDF
jgi:uncharacterized protein (TIGR02687 family)